MDLAERFSQRVAKIYGATSVAADLMPMVLSQACVDVVPVTGAGITLTGMMLRVPLGSSDETAAQAERLQATLGEGPCLTAAAREEPLVADLSTIADRWPIFHRELIARTPFRSVMSVPIRAAHGTCFGALDLYATGDDLPSGLSVAEITCGIADPMAAILLDQPRVDGAAALAPWLSNGPASSRMHVWVAVGILVEHAGLADADALAALRAHAFRQGTTLDEIAHQLMSEALQPDSVLA